MTEQSSTRRLLGVVAVLSSVFAVLGLIAHRAVSGTTLDHGVFGWMVNHRSPALTSWAVAVTEVGSPVGVGALTLVLSAVLWRRHRSPWPAVVVVGAVTVAGAVSTATKFIVGAHRPPLGLQLITETDPSFPSGHVTGTVALLGALAAVIGRHAAPVARVALVVLTMVGATAVALTRLYLGVHWVSDVVGGIVLGALEALLAHLLYRHVLRATGADTGTGGSLLPEPIHAVGASSD